MRQYSDSNLRPGGPRRYTSAESFARDGLGNDTATFTQIIGSATKPFETDVGDKRTTYQSGTGRQVSVRNIEPQPGGGTLVVRKDSLQYDESGNVYFSWTIGQAQNREVVRDDRAMFYSADGRLRVVDHRTATVGGPTSIDVPITLDFDEHRYDALGRRVLTRTQRECVITTPSLTCGLGTIRRTVWDGSQELVEIQQPAQTGTSDAALENDTAFAARQPIYQPGILNADLNPFYGRVAYTVGPSLDQPLSVTRWGYQADSSGELAQWPEPFTVVPHWNVRGATDNGAFDDGSIQHCGGTIPSRCLRVAWPFGWTANQQKVFQVAAWHGSVLEQKRDGSGLLFKRNRYLGPATGKFTQEDPIGLAGGLNLYGFAAGDPVNFSDPFGLCPPLDNQNGPECGRVVFVGVSGSAILGYGGSGAVGLILWSGEGPGVYVRGGGGFGGDVGASGEIGTSTNMNAFSGSSEGFAVALQGGFSYSRNKAGSTVAGSLGPRVDPELPLPIVTMHVEKSYTVKVTYVDVKLAVGRLREEAREFARQGIDAMNVASGIRR